MILMGLNIATGVLALLDALLWLWSTTVRLPDKFTSPYGKPPPQLAQMHRGLTLQSRRSAWGAIAAALAALCQVAATLWR